MADNKGTQRLSTTNGIGDLHQNLLTGLMEDRDGNVVVPDVTIPRGATKTVQQDQLGVFRRTVFDNGQVETIQTLPVQQGDGSIVTPVPLPGQQEDVAGTGQDEATKPKLAPSRKAGDKAGK
jgi:uncharacterized protein (DUF1684 family)